MFRPATFTIACFAMLASACAQPQNSRPPTSISFEIAADPANRVAHLTCKKSSSGECVVWVGNPASPDHRSLRMNVGASRDLADDGKGNSLCAKPVESDLSWPDCVASPSGAALNASRSIDYFFW